MSTITKVWDLVAEAKSTIENLTPEQVQAELEGGDVLLVDVREPHELAAGGVIPGAIHVPRGELEFSVDPSFEPLFRPEFAAERRTILYCAKGGRSALSAVALKKMGYTNVAHLDGGFAAWTESGCAVAKAPAQQ